MSKNIKINYNIGKVKYLVSFFDGVKKHKDGSDFWDITCFNSKTRMNKFLRVLNKKGYQNI